MLLPKAGIAMQITDTALQQDSNPRLPRYVPVRLKTLSIPAASNYPSNFLET